MPSQEDAKRAQAKMQSEAAVKELETLLKDGRRDEKVYYNIGVARINLEQWDLAKAAFIEALKQKPDFVEAMVNLGAVYHRGGDFEHAADYFDRALKLKPSFIQARANLGVALLMLGKYDESIQHMKKVVEVEANHPVGLATLAQAFLATGDKENHEIYKQRAEKAGVKFSDPK